MYSEILVSHDMCSQICVSHYMHSQIYRSHYVYMHIIVYVQPRIIFRISIHVYIYK